MLKKPLIIGGLGNMGRRYTAILRSLGIEPCIEDVGVNTKNDFDSIIVASPTSSHSSILKCVIEYGLPILCEKPISKNIEDVEYICDLAEEANTRLEMINQYKYCERGEPHITGDSYYNYFQTGKDGLVWDCISIIAISKRDIKLENWSPVWKCIINGETLKREDMDMAYVRMIRAWLYNELDDCGTNYIREAHKKVHNYIEATK